MQWHSVKDANQKGGTVIPSLAVNILSQGKAGCFPLKPLFPVLVQRGSFNKKSRPNYFTSWGGITTWWATTVTLEGAYLKSLPIIVSWS